nr:zinc finger, CCHC-type [Tanacetum cinerariifolium]
MSRATTLVVILSLLLLSSTLSFSARPEPATTAATKTPTEVVEVEEGCEGTAPSGQQVAPEILAAHSAWVKESKDIAGLMLMTMKPEIQRNMEPLHAHEMLKELKTLFAQQAEHELFQTTRDFHSCRQEEGQSVSSYVLKMKGYIDNLERLGHPVTLGLGVSLILIGLRKEYDGFVQNYNMHSMGC